MSGWNVSLYKLADPKDLTPGERLVVWQTGTQGLRWIDELRDQGRVRTVTEGGYPSRYLAPADAVRQVIDKEDGPPQARSAWTSGSGDTLSEGWLGATALDRQGMDRCEPDEWLLIEAWDES